jgi:hypothetical protein
MHQMKDEHWLHLNYFQVDHNKLFLDEEDIQKFLHEYVLLILIRIKQKLYTIKHNYWSKLEEKFLLE